MMTPEAAAVLWGAKLQAAATLVAALIAKEAVAPSITEAVATTEAIAERIKDPLLEASDMPNGLRGLLAARLTAEGALPLR
jgi:hypothetical protein